MTNSFKSIKVVTKITRTKNDPDAIMSSNVNGAIIKDPWVNLENRIKIYYAIYVDAHQKSWLDLTRRDPLENGF